MTDLVRAVLRYVYAQVISIVGLCRTVIPKPGATVFALGFNRVNIKWLKAFFPNHRVVRFGESSVISSWAQWRILHLPAQSTVVIHNYDLPPKLMAQVKSRHRCYFYEDGFVRFSAITQGRRSKQAPLSITLDSRALHFDRSRISDLDILLNEFDFQAPENSLLMVEATRLMDQFRERGISKYSFNETQDGRREESEVSSCDVLVIGQIPGDRSLQIGRENRMDLGDLVQLAAEENPGANVLFRPHPNDRPNSDYMSFIRSSGFRIQHPTVPLASSLSHQPKVYTFTSQAGFEALIHGSSVTVFGCPFYAGWGLTDDRECFVEGKRNRALTLTELFCGSLLLYPKYLSSTSSFPVESSVDFFVELWSQKK